MNKNSDTFAILLDGSLTVDEGLRQQVKSCRVIAADGGIRHAQPLGVTPELWVGDFDSAGNGFEKDFPGLERQHWPQDKAKSDGELAIEEAVARGAKSILLVGALGGDRTDHTLFNLALMLAEAENGVAISATSGTETAWPLPGPATLDLQFSDETLLSVFGFTDLHNLSVRQAKWPLQSVDVPFSSTWTLSNEAQGCVEIELKQGRAVVLARKKNLS